MISSNLALCHVEKIVPLSIRTRSGPFVRQHNVNNVVRQFFWLAITRNKSDTNSPMITRPSGGFVVPISDCKTILKSIGF